MEKGFRENQRKEEKEKAGYSKSAKIKVALSRKKTNMDLIKKDVFGRSLFLKKWIIRIIAALSYRRFNGINKLHITGTDNFLDLPDTNVLLISNHQTYFADATAIIHVINAALNGRKNSIKGLSYVWRIKLNLYYIAAKETMSKDLLTKILSYTGSIPVERTWRDGEKDLQRKVNPENVKNIDAALADGWVITFPQGTTKAWAPIRKGTAHMILKNKPKIIPIVIDGFRRSFDKKGLFLKKRGVAQKMEIKPPLEIDYENDSVDNIIEKIGQAIEQDRSFQ